jgi:hypothetical protein
MKRIVILVIVLLLFYGVAGGQAMNQAFLNSTVLVSFNIDDKSSSVGTGFFVYREIQSGKGHIFLVTNKHVLPKEGNEKSVNIRVNTRGGDKFQVQQIIIPIVGKDGKYLPTVILHPQQDFDVAVVHITEEVLKHGIEGTWIPYSLFVTKEKLKAENITVGDEIFLLGYPNAIYDPRNVSPILREGTISTIPTEEYFFNENIRKKFNLPEKIDGFLIDANVFPGSSGSLVILKQQPTTIGPQGETVVSRDKKIPYLLGIISGSIPIHDQALGSTQRMALGIVYSADTIKETIELFYK